MRENHKLSKKAYTLSLLDKEKRLDGRKMNDYREIHIEQNVLETAEGSALAKIGNTQVIAGIKLDILEPFPNEPNLGILITNGELLPLASRMFESGPPSEDSIEFSRVVDRGIRHAGVLPFDKMFIEEDKVLAVFLDLYVLDYSGNIIDTGALAAMAALMCTKIPKIEDGKLIREEQGKKLEINAEPVVTTTFNKIENHFLVDAALDEEESTDAKLTIGTSGEYVVSAQKSGSGTFKKDSIIKLIDIAFDKRKELVKHLNKSVKE